VTTKPQSAHGRCFQRIVRWLSEIVDSLPRWAKALLAVALVVNGIKALWSLATLYMWSIVHLVVKAI
jgi:hypothetical protein